MGGSAPSRGHRHARRGAPLLALLLATGALLLACGQPGAITTSPAHAPATTGTTPAGHTAADAPAPVRSPARTRPVPSASQASVPASPLAVRAPEAPCSPRGYGDGMPRLATQVRSSAAVALVRVAGIHSARWTTPDGRRPALPQTGSPYHQIITPVLVEVERYLKGDQPEQRLLLAVEGGVVGPDCAAPIRTDAWYPRDGYVLDGRLVVFLRRPAEPLHTLEGAPLWPEVHRYGVGSDELVTVPRDDLFAPRTIPLQQLLAEIAAAQERP